MVCCELLPNGPCCLKPKVSEHTVRYYNPSFGDACSKSFPCYPILFARNSTRYGSRARTTNNKRNCLVCCFPPLKLTTSERILTPAAPERSSGWASTPVDDEATPAFDQLMPSTGVQERRLWWYTLHLTSCGILPSFSVSLQRTTRRLKDFPSLLILRRRTS